MPTDHFAYWDAGGAPVLVTNATTADGFDYWDGSTLVLQLDLTLLGTTLALTLDDVTVAADGAAASTATLALPLDDVTPALALHPEGACSLTLTLDEVTVLLTGVEAASATLAATLADVTVALEVAVDTTAVLAVTLDDVRVLIHLGPSHLRGTAAWYAAALHALTLENA